MRVLKAKIKKQRFRTGISPEHHLANLFKAELKSGEFDYKKGWKPRNTENSMDNNMKQEELS